MLTLRDCPLTAFPGRVTLALPGGRVLTLTADDLARLEPLTRADDGPADHVTCDGCFLAVPGLTGLCPDCGQPFDS